MGRIRPQAVEPAPETDAPAEHGLGATPLDIHLMDKGRCILKIDGFEVTGVFYLRSDAPIVLTGNSHECR